MNIALLLDMAADAFGDRTAVTAADGTHLTYRDLRAAARAAAARLRHDEPVTLTYLGPEDPAVPIAMFAAAYAGTTYAPLNDRLPAPALAALVGRVLPAAAVTRPESAATAAAAGAAPVTTIRDWRDGLHHAGEDGGTREAPEAPEAPAVLLFTSGTSAEPKAVRLRHDNLLAYILGTVEFGTADPDESLLLAVPPFHIAGVSAVLSSVHAARRIVTLPAFSAESWLAAARRERITHAFVVPTMLARINAVLAADPSSRPPALRHLAYGGARMPRPVLEQALELLPGTGFVNAYGLTETSSTIAVLGPEDHHAAAGGDERARERLNSVGRPVPGIEIRVTGQAGGELPPGVRGELWLRGAQISGAVTGEDGWFATGDQASIDHDGYLYVHGRGEDTIIRGGENIAPGEIEDALIRHPAVAAACAVGLPDPEWGERVEAAVVPRPGRSIDGDEVTAWLRERIGALKTPQALHVVAELPLTPTGKVVRRLVRERLS